MSPESKYKEAGKHFLISAAIFEKLRLESVGLKPHEITLDLSEINLQICRNIMKGQAQNCAIEKIKKHAADRYSLLAQLSMQASAYYKNAYTLIESPSMDNALSLKKFLPIIAFNESTFRAKANFLMSQKYKKEVKETKKGIGKAIAYILIAYKILEGIKKYEANLPSGTRYQYNELVKIYTKHKESLEEVNSRPSYHEEVPKEVDKIECKPFTIRLSLDEDLNVPFEGKEILSRLIPRTVQNLEEEYKGSVKSTIDSTIGSLTIADNEQEEFWKKHDLPSSLYAASGEQKLPEDLLVKIQQCKERGGTKLLRHSLDSLISSTGSIELQLNTMQSQLQSEIDEDEQFRRTYGPNSVPERVSNFIQKMLNYIGDYRNKVKARREIDAVLSKMLEDEGVKFEIIEIDKAEIVQEIPKSICAERESSFVAIQYFYISFHRLTNLVKKLEELKREGQRLSQEMMVILETDNINNELFQVYHNFKKKEIVFSESGEKYNKIKSAIDGLIIQRRELLAEIDKCMKEFVKEKPGQDEDPNRISFFKRIDDECNNFGKCYEKLYQETYLCAQLTEEVNKLSGIVNDFITSRTNDKEKLSKSFKKV